MEIGQFYYFRFANGSLANQNVYFDETKWFFREKRETKQMRKKEEENRIKIINRCVSDWFVCLFIIHVTQSPRKCCVIFILDSTIHTLHIYFQLYNIQIYGIWKNCNEHKINLKSPLSSLAFRCELQSRCAI